MQIIKDIKTKLDIEITYSIALKAKEIAFTKINDIYENAYKSLSKYYENILYINLNNIIIIEYYNESS